MDNLYTIILRHKYPIRDGISLYSFNAPPFKANTSVNDIATTHTGIKILRDGIANFSGDL